MQSDTLSSIGCFSYLPNFRRYKKEIKKSIRRIFNYQFVDTVKNINPWLEKWSLRRKTVDGYYNDLCRISHPALTWHSHTASGGDWNTFLTRLTQRKLTVVSLFPAQNFTQETGKPYNINQLRNTLGRYWPNVMHPDLNRQDPEGFTPLTKASYYDQPDIIRLLIQSGVDINQVDASTWTPLIAAVDQNCVESARILLEAGADINKPDETGFTPLHTAAMVGHDNMAEMLLAAGAEINVVNDDGWSPLMVACFEGHECIVKRLVKCHADINGINNNRTSVFQLACDSAIKTKKTSMLAFLIEHKAKIFTLDKNNWFPLLTLISGDFISGVELLLSKGWEEAISGRESEVFYLAAREGYESMLRLLFHRTPDERESFNHISRLTCIGRARSVRYPVDFPLRLIDRNFNNILSPEYFEGGVCSLKHLCRRIIQKQMVSLQVEELPVHNCLQLYCWQIPVYLHNQDDFDDWIEFYSYNRSIDWSSLLFFA